MRKSLAVILSLLAAPAFGQTIKQYGTVTSKHLPYWVTSGVIGDGGSSADSPISSIGVTNNGGAGICVSSDRQSAAGRNQLCFGASTAGAATISLQNYGTATAQSLQFIINGVTQGFPTVGSLPVTANGLVCFANVNGTLQDCSLGTGVRTALGVNVGSSGAFVVQNGVLGTPTSGVLTNATGLPVSTGLTGAGTGVLAALGINVGTAGAFVVNGGALGSPSSAGTLPAFTLGGTIAGGGNQLNNIIIGNVTPLAGSFTTAVAGTLINTPIIAPTSDGTTNLRINNFAQTHNIVTVDTTNFRIGINKNPGAFDLDVAGAVNFASTLAVTGHVTLEGVTSTAATGTGALVFGTAPTITLTNGTGLPISTGLTGVGTGVLTALGINVGTAGAFVVNGGALGSPSSAGTIPAFTLGGTIAGGGNQINNAIIGTTTPLAGFFTTLSATTSLTSPLHIGGTTTTSTVTLQSTSGVGTTGADIIAKVGNNGATEAWRTLNSGFMGIGTNAPQTILHVNLNTVQNVPNIIPGIQVSLADTGAGGVQIDAFGSSNPQISMRTAGGTAASKTATSSGNFLFILDGEGYNGSVYSGQGLWASVAAETWAGTNRGTYGVIHTTPIGSSARAEAVRIQASGGVSIGTTTDPGIGSLQINANAFAPNLPTTTGALGAAICWTTATGQFQRDTNAGGCLVSSERYKHDIRPISDGLSMVMASNPVTFVYNDNVGVKGQQVGFIAEQMATVSEDLVGRLDDGTVNSVRYMQYTAVLARAIQQLKTENDNLSQKISRLENR